MHPYTLYTVYVYTYTLYIYIYTYSVYIYIYVDVYVYIRQEQAIARLESKNGARRPLLRPALQRQRRRPGRCGMWEMGICGRFVSLIQLPQIIPKTYNKYTYIYIYIYVYMYIYIYI